MCSTTWLDITYYAETFGFLLSVFLNLILLFLISEMPKKTFGSYKYLMFSFSVLGIYYSSCDFWCKPNVHFTEVSFAVFNDLRVTGFNKFSGTIVLAIYCSCYGMMLALLTIHFYYRYLSVTCPTKLSKFSLIYLPYWILLLLINFLMWFSAVYYLNGPSPMKDQLLYPEFLNDYCLSPQDVSYVGPQYFYEDLESGTLRIHIPSWVASGAMGCVMTFTFLCLTYFGLKTYLHLKKFTVIAGKKLQNQLFRTLVIQTIIPTVFMYLPVSCMFLFPLFGWKIQAMEPLIAISVAVYPCFEPLVAMCCIRSFRRRITGILTCRSFKKEVKVSNVPTLAN